VIRECEQCLLITIYYSKKYNTVIRERYPLLLYGWNTIASKKTHRFLQKNFHSKENHKNKTGDLPVPSKFQFVDLQHLLLIKRGEAR
jgi:hypothetical protein